MCSIPTEWIAYIQIREAAEVAVGAPEFADAVQLADCGNSGIVDPRAREAGGESQFREYGPVSVGLGEHEEAR